MLHPLDEFFLFDGIAEGFYQVDDRHVFVCRFLQRVPDPFIALAAYIDKQIAAGNTHDVVGCGLIAVQIHAVVQQHAYFGVLRLFTEHIHDPVIDREDRRHDPLFRRSGRFLRRSSPAYAQKAERKDEYQHTGKQLFHKKTSDSIQK